jgi:hypothetical protein
VRRTTRGTTGAEPNQLRLYLPEDDKADGQRIEGLGEREDPAEASQRPIAWSVVKVVPSGAVATCMPRAPIPIVSRIAVHV